MGLLGVVVIGAIIADGGYEEIPGCIGLYFFFQLVDVLVSFKWLFKANTFRQQSLEARGYKLVDIIEGRTKDEVLAKLKSTS